MRNIYKLRSIIYACVLTCLCSGALGLSDKRLCADPKCEKPISLARALINYHAGGEGLISVQINSNVRVMSKSAGSDPSLWGVSVNGRRGYLPKHVIKEEKMLAHNKDVIHEVPVEAISKNQSPPAAVAEGQPNPVLNASEGIGLNIDLETTTTAPLNVQIKADAGIKTAQDNKENIEMPVRVASPVQQQMDIIDGTQLPIAEINSEKSNEAIKPEISIPVVKEEVKVDGRNPVLPQLPLESSSDKKDGIKAGVESSVGKEIKPEGQIPVLSQLSSNEKNDIKTVNQVPIVKEVKTESQIPISEQLSPETKSETNDNTKIESPTIVVEHGNNETQLHIPDETVKADIHPPITETKVDPKSLNSYGENVDKSSEEEEEGDYDDDYENDDDVDDYKNNDIPIESLTPKNETQPSEDIKINLAETASSQVVIEPNVSQEVKVPEIVEETTVKTEVVTETTQTDNKEIYTKEPEDNKKQNIETENVATAKIDVSSNHSEILAKSPEIRTENNQAEQHENTKEKGSLLAVESHQDNNANEHKNVTIEQSSNESETKKVESATSTSEASEIITENVQTDQNENVQENGTIQGVEKQKNNDTIEYESITLAPLPNKHETENIESTTQFTPIQEDFYVNVERTVTEPGFHYEHNDDDFDVTTISPKMPVAQAPELQQHSNDEKAQEQNVELQNDERYKREEEQTKTKDLPLQQVHEEEKHTNENNQIVENVDNKNIEHHKPIDPNEYYQQQRNEQEQHHDSHNQPQEKPQQQHQQIPETTYTTTDGTINLHEHENQQEESNRIENGSAELTQNQVSSISNTESTTPVALPSTIPPEIEVAAKKENGLFATILGTVNSFISNDKKEPARVVDQDDELERILFPERAAANQKNADTEYCDRLVSDCPSSSTDSNIYGGIQSHNTVTDCKCDRTMPLDNFAEIVAAKVLEMSDMLVCLSIAAAASLFFIFGYYCFCNSSREGALLSKLNLLERSLLATHKENAILKHEIMETRGKLSSIQDNSFGSNDMVIALKKELEEEIFEKHKLQEQVGNLEKELENAAEAGLELNKIVSELLTNQTGDESIISSVEELQRHLNEQQNTIYEINTNLAEKSRENSELQLMFAEQNARLGGEIASLQQDNDELEAEKSNLQTRLDEIKNEFEEDITKALEGKNFEIRRLQFQITDLNVKCENEHMKWQTSLAKIEALEECLKAVKRDPSVNIKEVIDVANVRADLLDLQKQRASLKERLDAEKDSTKMLDDQVKTLSAECEKLKHEFNQSEKDKLEAQTRLEVLSNYFKDKEMQLQKELSIKEAMWLKQQGETTSTVDRLTSMQEEIQSLKSQNDALRAEIEAQLAAHKAQTGTLENRAHETWLAARQSERRCEEARAEATALRRKLTALVGGNHLNDANRLPNAAVDVKLIAGELNNAVSPIHMEPPSSPLLGRMPPPPFLPPPFMGPPPPFMPPPFMPPGEMRPPPLGRLMSPAPPPHGGPPHSTHLRSARYTSPRGDYDDYDDDDDDDLSPNRSRRRSIGGNDSWHRDSYSPPRTYRSHSPTDSRYNYTEERDLISTYDTETDISPPPSPRGERRQRGGRAGSFKAYSPQPTASSPISEGGRNGRNTTANKEFRLFDISRVRSTSCSYESTSEEDEGALSSGSEKSYNSSARHGNKAKGKGKGMV